MTTNLSKSFNTVWLMLQFAKFGSTNADVTSGYEFQAAHAVFLPLPWKQETVSQPVTAWKRDKAALLLGPRDPFQVIIGIQKNDLFFGASNNHKAIGVNAIYFD
jgi:hypothetical protein